MTLEISEEQFDKALKEALEYFPGIDLKPGQAACIRRLSFYQQDVLGVLPTGYGKSLIYQILPKLFTAIWRNKYNEEKQFKIIVINPLELIRRQQVEKLVKIGIKAATLENSQNVSDAEIIFGSAEQWLSESWKKELKEGCLKDVSVLVVDEAHTVETW